MQVLEDDDLQLLSEGTDAAADGEEPLPEGFTPDRHEWIPEGTHTASDQDDDAATDEGGDGEISITEVVLLPRPWARRHSDFADSEREHDVTVLAVRRGNEVIRKRLQDVQLRPSDVLLVQTSEDAQERLRSDRSVIISGEGQWEQFDRARIPVALGILAGSSDWPHLRCCRSS